MIQCNIQLEEVVTAYYQCRKNKRNTDGQLLFELDLEYNLHRLHRDLVCGGYEISPSICFTVAYPKSREVWAANFRDRIVHHILYNRFAHHFIKQFIRDSFACIPNRGTLDGIERAEYHIKSESNNWSEPCFYLKCDFANFFTSIDKTVLWEIQEPKLRSFNQEDWVIELTKKVLFNDCTKNAVFNSTEIEMNSVPRRKSLLYAPLNVGLPIGNLSSQLDANILLNEIDQFAKHRLKIKHYCRYVDDILIISKSKEQLFNWYSSIVDKSSKLGLTFNPTKTLCHSIRRGVTFIGQTIYPHRTVPSKSTERRILKEVVRAGKSLDSYIHFFKQSRNSYNLVHRLAA